MMKQFGKKGQAGAFALLVAAASMRAASPRTWSGGFNDAKPAAWLEGSVTGIRLKT